MDTKEIVNWLMDEASDEDFVELFCLLDLKRKEKPLELTKEAVLGLDVPALTGWIGDVLDEVIFSEEIDESAWWKYKKVYHRTTPENAKAIRETGIMKAKENGLFFGSSKEGEISGYGSEILEFEFPAEMLVLDDEFPNGEKHYRIPLRTYPYQLDVTNYLVRKEEQ